MSRWTSVGSIAATATLLSTTASFADVTAADVWEDWKSYMEGVGYTVSAGSEDMSGDMLTITDLSTSMTFPEGDGMMVMLMPTVEFKERGDGTVEVMMPDEYTVTLEGDGGAESLDMELTVTQTGMTIIASGDEAETAYNFVAADIKIEATRFLVDDTPIDATVVANMAGYTGNYIVTDGDTTGISGSARADTFNMAVVVNEPEEDVVIDIALNGKDVDGEVTMTLPETFDAENMAANIQAGFAAQGEYSLGAMTMKIAGSGDGESFNMDATMDGADVSFVMDENGLGLNELVKALDVTISGSEIPLPQINVRAAEYGLNFLMPLSKSEEPDDFALGLRVVDLAVQDEIWGMFDPAGILPHDPATLIVDTVGQANWFIDIMDPKAQEAAEMSGEAPGALHALTLKNLQFSIAGAELTGAGDFTFDNDDLVSFEGMPRPEGAIDLKLVGGNGLLDKLVEMGLMPDDQAMGTRMMMGLFAVPGDGEDTLNSKIEINEEGHIMANGQRLK